MFNAKQTASQINFAELWGYAVGGDPTNFPSELAARRGRARRSCPGITSGTSGSINGFEGFGINKFGTQKEARSSFLKYLSGPEYQKTMNLGKTLPSSRTSVLNDPDVKAAYPVGAVLAEQGALQPRPLRLAVRLDAAVQRRVREALPRRDHRRAGARGDGHGRPGRSSVTYLAS